MPPSQKFLPSFSWEASNPDLSIQRWVEAHLMPTLAHVDHLLLILSESSIYLWVDLQKSCSIWASRDT